MRVASIQSEAELLRGHMSADKHLRRLLTTNRAQHRSLQRTQWIEKLAMVRQNGCRLRSWGCQLAG